MGEAGPQLQILDDVPDPLEVGGQDRLIEIVPEPKPTPAFANGTCSPAFIDPFVPRQSVGLWSLFAA